MKKEEPKDRSVQGKLILFFKLMLLNFILPSSI